MPPEGDDTTGQESTTGAAGSGSEGGAAAAGSEGGDEVARLQAEAKTAREEAEKLRDGANADAAKLAQERSALADEKAKFAEQRAAAAEKQGGDTFPREVVEKLRKEAAGYRVTANESKDKLKELEDKTKSEGERAAERATLAETRADKAEQTLLRITVAAKKNLPADLAERLVGETREELEKDADKLLKTVGAQRGRGLDQGQQGADATPPKGDGMNDWIRKGFGRA